MPAPFIIRPMTWEELPFAAECTRAEGWVSETLTVFEGFYRHDPAGCLIALREGRPAGICMATPFGTSGFVGELIVRPEARGSGLGAELLQRGVAYLQERAISSVYLDGVLKAVPLYERNGFRKICRSWRFSGRLTGRSHPCIHPMTQDDLPEVCALDRKYFGDDRGFFLAYRLEKFPDVAYVYRQNGCIKGFIMGRYGDNYVSAGPWVVTEDVCDPVQLLEAVAQLQGDTVVSTGILDANKQAVQLMESLGFKLREDSPWRMVNGLNETLGASPACFAVGSAAKG